MGGGNVQRGRPARRGLVPSPGEEAGRAGGAGRALGCVPSGFADDTAEGRHRPLGLTAHGKPDT